LSLRSQRDLGSLEVGKQADVVVLSEDVFTCDEMLIPEIRPVLTLVGGEIVYRAGWTAGPQQCGHMANAAAAADSDPSDA
jgi:cytosine/adenosine deaminase-related metal-dependent hydrolase